MIRTGISSARKLKILNVVYFTICVVVLILTDIFIDSYKKKKLPMATHFAHRLSIFRFHLRKVLFTAPILSGFKLIQIYTTHLYDLERIPSASFLCPPIPLFVVAEIHKPLSYFPHLKHQEGCEIVPVIGLLDSYVS